MENLIKLKPSIEDELENMKLKWFKIELVVGKFKDAEKWTDMIEEKFDQFSKQSNPPI